MQLKLLQQGGGPSQGAASKGAPSPHASSSTLPAAAALPAPSPSPTSSFRGAAGGDPTSVAGMQRLVDEMRLQLAAQQREIAGKDRQLEEAKLAA